MRAVAQWALEVDGEGARLFFFVVDISSLCFFVVCYWKEYKVLFSQACGVDMHSSSGASLTWPFWEIALTRKPRSESRVGEEGYLWATTRTIY